MALTALARSVREAPFLQALAEALASPGVRRVPLPTPAVPLVLSALWSSLQRPFLVVVPTPEEGRRLADDLALLVGPGEVALFPETEALPYERLAVDEGTVFRRLSTLVALLHGDTPLLVVASAQALLHRLPPRDAFAGACLTLRPGMDAPPEDLSRRLASLGYQRVGTVEGPGAFSLRGGILDLFPVGSPEPVRLEFFGNTVDTVRRFDPLTQRSVGPAPEVRIPPAREVLPALGGVSALSPLLQAVEGPSPALERVREDLSRLFAGEALPEAGLYAGFFNPHGLLHYFPQEGVVVLLRPQRVEEAAMAWEGQAEGVRGRREGQGELPRAFPRPHLLWGEVSPLLDAFPTRLLLDPWGEGEFSPDLTLPPAFRGDLDALARWLGEHRRGGGRAVLITRHARRVTAFLGEKGVGVRPQGDSPLQPGEVLVAQGDLTEGVTVALPDGPLALLTDRELFGAEKGGRRPHPSPTPAPRKGEALLAELAPGRYVVHVDYGIGRFLGMQRRQVGEATRDYLVLEYAEGARLYVPVDHLDRVSPYHGPTDQPPPLSRLGSPEWAQTKQRVRVAVREVAKDLLTLYATRQVVEGYAFSPDTPWQRELEDSFPYEETPDQATAVEEVKRDMEAPRPMDRLVCGDVGFGKTEVAVRAAFKAVIDGKQVAVLAPTTILAQQHYDAFRERLSPFPVRIALLTRLVPPDRQKAVLRDLASGGVDIVIGTHRLLSRDVRFKDLGLVVVDDEHRFGVTQKEHLKRLRAQVDVLTLTATPIPRTLAMALGGLRDISLIRTPPQGRLPVKTFVARDSDDLVREAVLREMARQGQVYYLCNLIREIPRAVQRVRALAPGVRVVAAHGRMDERGLMEAVERFRRGEADVLVCTTIIEAGLDVPTANTLIVEGAHRLGLAQMHQLRGRVGRSDRQAYAYFLIPRGLRLTPEAEARLQTILAASELGAGFRIALRDLEIRGAGNLLGPQQSGHIHAVGWDLYLQMLQEAVEELKGKAPPAEGEEARPQVTIDLPLAAYLPDTYVGDEAQRVALYQRMVGITTLEEVEALEEELRDRFGAPPPEVGNLLQVLRWKALAIRAGVRAIAYEGEEMVLRLREPIGGAQPALEKRLAPVARVGRETVRFLPRGRWQPRLTWVLERMAAFRQEALALVQNPP